MMWTDRESFLKVAKGHTEASLFHVLAAPVFSRLGLQLANNPYERFGRYGGCSALYELRSGLALSVGMEPGDSNALTLGFGRKWFVDGQLAAFSNHYFVFARQVGIDLPKFYAMGFQEQLIRPFRAVIGDIEGSWTAVLGSLSDVMIEQAERSEFGAVQILEGRREVDPTGVVTVAEWDATKTS